ncbi:nucleobindin-2 isoform X3 [Vanessa atalanta]|uniref:nucleobindin-2 isoform X3 n=1 Tax=Vanessa atalanta TaxID=42275 RepID=UPI001FCCFB3B|nr:nucleobindin-2 isoform X3 [Vanessa atalanta]
MRLCIHIFILVALLHCSYAPPVTPEKKDQDSDVVDDVAEYTEYHRYLQEVVQALESDADFRERLEKADEDDVRSGRIAEQLDFVNHNVRSKLDEIKRRELDRLRHLATKQFELTNELDVHSKVPTNEHLDHTNPHTFEIEDLKKLIQKTTADLEAADKKRKEEFKEYEMQKEFEKHQKIEAMNEAEKKEYMEAAKKEEEAKKHHQPLHHPASKDQLLEVWNTADNMDPKDFDPKVFFVMHDVDGNGVWDANEVKALFIKELNKMYGPTGPNTDLHERAEEMERMREHFFKENDRNHDGLIDYNEFMMETQKPEFNRDEGWQPIDENQIYTQAEYEAYERKRLETLHYLQQRGLVDAHGRPIPGAEHQIHQAIKQHQQQQQQMAYQQSQYHGAQGQYHPQGQPMGQPQYAPVQGYQQPPAYQQGQPQGQVPQGQQQGQYQGQVPQGQQQGQYQGQVPQGQYQGQVPQGQPQGQYQGQAPQGQPQGQYQGQAPQGQYQGQVPQGQYQGQGQVPQGQYQGQVPQGQQQGQNQGQYQAPNQGQPIQQNQQQQQQNVPVQAAQVPQAQQPPQAQSAPNVDSNHT